MPIYVPACFSNFSISHWVWVNCQESGFSSCLFAFPQPSHYLLILLPHLHLSFLHISFLPRRNSDPFVLFAIHILKPLIQLTQQKPLTGGALLQNCEESKMKNHVTVKQCFPFLKTLVRMRGMMCLKHRTRCLVHSRHQIPVMVVIVLGRANIFHSVIQDKPCT